MGGGLMQLVAYGAQDAFLTGNPEITFFKVVYRRHTNFAMESIRQTFSGNAGWGSRATATISRNGDLISRCYVQAKLPKINKTWQAGDLYVLQAGAAEVAIADGSTIINTSTPDAAGNHPGRSFVNSVGHKLIKEVDLEIGGQLIDRHYAEWLEIWSELTLPAAKVSGYDAMVGKSDFRQTEDQLPDSGDMLYVPLQFFFCRNPGLALPLIALQYHEVKLTFQFGSIEECTSGIGPSSRVDNDLSPELWVDYVYLDTDERRRFAQTQHNMLVDQLQYSGGSTEDNMYLSFNHPCKELIWVVQGTDTSNNEGFDFKSIDPADPADTDTKDKNIRLMAQGGPVKSAVLKLNGHDRFEQREGAYFTLVQPYQHHTRIPRSYVYCYSFALNPEEHQPSGSCNFSRIDNARLILERHADVDPAAVNKVFAVNYNILRIQSGMAGLAFSN